MIYDNQYTSHCKHHIFSYSNVPQQTKCKVCCCNIVVVQCIKSRISWIYYMWFFDMLSMIIPLSSNSTWTNNYCFYSSWFRMCIGDTLLLMEKVDIKSIQAPYNLHQQILKKILTIFYEIFCTRIPTPRTSQHPSPINLSYGFLHSMYSSCLWRKFTLKVSLPLQKGESFLIILPFRAASCFHRK